MAGPENGDKGVISFILEPLPDGSMSRRNGYWPHVIDTLSDIRNCVCVFSYFLLFVLFIVMWGIRMFCLFFFRAEAVGCEGVGRLLLKERERKERGGGVVAQ